VADAARMEGAKIRQAMARLMHGTAVRCLQAWQAVVVEHQRLEALCQSVAYRIMSMAALAALSKWQEYTAEAVHHREIVSRCLHRLLKRSQVAAFHAWGHFTESRVRQKEAYDRVLAIPQRRFTRFGWTVWREAFADRQKLRKAAATLMKSGAVRALRVGPA